MPVISVFIPFYNAEPFLKDAIDSVLCQTFHDFELILLDDGSTDNSVDIVRAYSDPRISFFPCAHDYIATLNRGLALSTGKYIALHDADDLMMPYRLQVQYDFMESHPDIAVCGGYVHTFGRFSMKMKSPLTHDELVFNMIVSNPVHNPTGFIRRQILIDNNIWYQKGYSFAADYKFWFDVSKVGRLQTIPKILTLYRTSMEQATIKYRHESIPACRRLQNEMIDYHLSQFENNHPHIRKIMPVVQKMNEAHFFDEETYHHFIRELLIGLQQKVLHSDEALLANAECKMQNYLNLKS